MANTTVLRGLAIAKFVVVETVANATVRRGPKEKNLVDWQWDSNQCNYIASGKPSWSVTLKGSDLESQKGKMCPF